MLFGDDRSRINCTNGCSSKAKVLMDNWANRSWHLSVTRIFDPERSQGPNNLWHHAGMSAATVDESVRSSSYCPPGVQPGLKPPNVGWYISSPEC